MKRYIVHTGPAHPGIVLYVCLEHSGRLGRSFALFGQRHNAEKFETRTAATVVSRRFSTIYDLQVTEVNA